MVWELTGGPSYQVFGFEKHVTALAQFQLYVLLKLLSNNQLVGGWDTTYTEYVLVLYAYVDWGRKKKQKKKIEAYQYSLYIFKVVNIMQSTTSV